MNTHQNQTRVFGTFILAALLLALLFPTTTAFADDTTPPGDASTAIDSPVEEGAPPEEEGTPEEEAVPKTEKPKSEQPVLGEPATEDAIPEELVVEEPLAEEAESVVEEEPMLTQVPDGTDVVVLDKQGEPVPLATQEAAEAVSSSDPMWCPDGVAPIANTGGCTDSYPSMTALLAALSGAGQPTQNGTIWIEATYDSSAAEPAGTTHITIDGASFSTWADYSLTVQGGWDGTASGTISGTSLFAGDRFRIINWRNDVTVMDIVVDGDAVGSSLVIEIDTPGINSFDVTLENVEVMNNTANMGAYIINTESTGSVTVNNSSFTNNGDNDDEHGLRINAMGNVTLLNILATGNGGNGVDIFNTLSSAAASVQVLGTNVFSGNEGNGLLIRSNGNITLNNITADGNNNRGVDIDNCIFSISVGACLGSGDVTITGTNNFSGNIGNTTWDAGLFIASKGNVTLYNIAANGNANFGVYIDNTPSYSGATVTMNGINVINNNLNDGLVVFSDGTITVNEITANNNGTDISDNGVELDNDTGTADVIITGYYNSFSNNTGPGVQIHTNGNIELYFATITGNNTALGSLNGAIFDTPGITSHSARVYCGVFGNNQGYGLDAWDFENSLTFVGLNNFSGNPSGDYNFNGTASFEDPDYLCEEPILGCTDPEANNYDPDANTDDGSCTYDIYGCTDPNANNYDPTATIDDGSCTYDIYGCTDPNANNYDPTATIDDGSCTYDVYGCTDPNANNYDPTATIDDGSCKYAVFGGTGAGGERKASPNTSTLIPVAGGQAYSLSCETPMTKLQMLNGDFVVFADLCGYTAMLEAIPEDGLPGKLDGGEYVSGINVTLLHDGDSVDPLPESTSMSVAFKVPAGKQAESFAILRWDGGGWVEENVSLENGYVMATTSHTGTFALVVK